MYALRRPLAAALAAASLALLPACAGDGTGSTSSPGVHLITRLPQSDTVTAVLPVLEVLVRDQQGKPAAGVTVEISALRLQAPDCPAPCPKAPSVLFNPGYGGYYASEATAATDGEGKARFQAALNGVAGEGGFTLRAATLGYESTEHITIKPGAMATVSLLPSDTVVRIGGSYTLSASPADRFGNLRSGSVSLAIAGTDATLQGNTVTGRAFGRAQIVASVNGVNAFAHVSVVPAATVAASSGLVGIGTPGVVVMGLDGSSPHTFSVAGGTTVQDWNAAGTKLLLLYRVLDQPGQIVEMDASSGVSRMVYNEFGPAHYIGAPRYSPDGLWVYFNGYTSSTSNELLWRIHPDGSGLERVVEQLDSYTTAGTSDPSPDGTRVAYSGRRGIDDGWNDLFILNLAAGTHTQVQHDFSFSPRGSPAGDLIAYLGLGARPWVIKPDGSGRKLLLDGPVRSAGGWSPDGKYLLIHGDLSWVVVDVSSGEVVPLPERMTRDLYFPLWKP
jgi:hypothetical protein